MACERVYRRLGGFGRGGPDLNIIPAPVSVEALQGRFRFTSETTLVAAQEGRMEAAKLVAALAVPMGYRLPLSDDVQRTQNSIRLRIDAAAGDRPGREGYELEVTPHVRIVHYPRFQWRGPLIDPARHFIPVADVERFIDIMAIHKLNPLSLAGVNYRP